MQHYLVYSYQAFGDNILKYIDYDGIVLVDLLKVMQRDQPKVKTLD